MEGPDTFDVEEYRADLERRRDSLREREHQYFQKWKGSKRQTDYNYSVRCGHKAGGIDIALSLLPRKECQ